MFLLDVGSVTRYGQVGNQWRPQAISTHCPHCSEKVLFATPPNVWFWDLQRRTLVSTSECPGCVGAVHFWAINANSDTQPNREPEYLAMYPIPRSTRQPIPALDKVPAPVRRAYLEAVGAYNARLWGPSATSVRRTLEGIVMALLPGGAPSTDTLAKKIRDLRTADELAKPLIDLSDALRQGGNIGAHFDEVREADEAMARAALDLIEYLLEYVYTLPGAISDFKQTVSAED